MINFKVDLSKASESKPALVAGTYDFTCLEVQPENSKGYERGFVLVLNANPNNASIRYTVWTHTEKALAAAQVTVATWYKLFEMNTQLPVESLKGKRFKATIVENENGYMEIKGFLHGVKQSMPNVVRPVVSAPSVPPKPSVPTPAPKPAIPAVQTQVHTPTHDMNNTMCTNGHTVQELLNAGWGNSDIADVLPESADFDSDIPL